MKLKSAMRPYLAGLGSMTLAIVLLVVLSLASVIGTVLLQNQEQADYLQQFGPLWYHVFQGLGLFDMYHAWWFLTLLGFLMVSLSVCLVRHTPRMLREMRSRRAVIADKSIARFHHVHHWRLTEGGAERLESLAAAVLPGWQTRTETQEDHHYLRADRGRRNKWGYILSHLGILVILVGGLVSVQFGFRGNMAVVEGGEESAITFLRGSDVERRKMPFTVRCNDFSIDFFPTGQPREFRSNLTIIDDGEEVLTSDVIVNEPIYYEGVRIYQSSFGDGGSALKFRLFHLDGSRRVDTAEVKVYETWRDPETGVTLQIKDFKPFNVQNMAAAGEPKQFQDLGPSVEYVIRGPGLRPVMVKSFMNPLIIDGQNQGSLMLVSLTGDAADYQSFYLGLDLTNPKEWRLFHEFASRVRGSDAEADFETLKRTLSEVLGREDPGARDMGLRTLQAMQTLPDLPWPFVPVLDDFDQVHYTGLQLTRDPGMNVVWFGSGLLVVGLCILFYMPHRRVWLVLRPVEGRGEERELVLAGTTNRNRLGFEREFHRILTEMDRQLPEQRTA